VHCNRFIGETLVDALWLLDKSVVAAAVAAAMYQEATSNLMSLLIMAGLSLNVFWQGPPSLYHV